MISSSPSHTISRRETKHMNGSITFYRGMKLIPMMSFIEHWAWARKAKPHSPLSFPLLYANSAVSAR